MLYKSDTTCIYSQKLISLKHTVITLIIHWSNIKHPAQNLEFIWPYLSADLSFHLTVLICRSIILRCNSDTSRMKHFYKTSSNFVMCPHIVLSHCSRRYGNVHKARMRLALGSNFLLLILALPKWVVESSPLSKHWAKPKQSTNPSYRWTVDIWLNEVSCSGVWIFYV